MSTQTIAEVAKFTDDEIVRDLAVTIETTNPWWRNALFTSFSGSALVVNQEQTLGDVQRLNVGGTITARSPSVAQQVTYSTTTFVGQVDLNKKVQAIGTSDGFDTRASELKSKAKSLARAAQSDIAIGDGIKPNMNSFHTLVPASQFTAASAGQALSFELLDESLSLVKAKDGVVDFIVLNTVQHNNYKALVRALGGVAETIAFEMPNGQTLNVTAYMGIPMFVNNYITNTETANGAALTGGALTSAYVGVWDDDTKAVGFSMLYNENLPAGLRFDQVGTSEIRDETIDRVLADWEFALFSPLGGSRITSLT